MVTLRHSRAVGSHVSWLTPCRRAGGKLRRRTGRQREHLTVFVADPHVPPTNNVSGRALRLGVVFRKVTNGSRSKWGAETCAAFRSVVGTARIRGNIVLSAVQEALHSQPLRAPG